MVEPLINRMKLSVHIIIFRRVFVVCSAGGRLRMIVSSGSVFLYHANRDLCKIERMLDGAAVGTDEEIKVWL